MELSHEHEARILSYLCKRAQRSTIPPTIEEIMRAVDLPSKSHVHRDLSSLEAKGYIRRHPRKGRGIELLLDADGQPVRVEALRVPLLGTIAAGHPIPVPNDAISPDDYVDVARSLVGNPEEVFALRVKGDSMIDASINDGDIVLMRHQSVAEEGEMVAVWLQDREETTLKRFYREGDQVILKPANPAFPVLTFPADRVELQGKVMAVIRRVA